MYGMVRSAGRKAWPPGFLAGIVHHQDWKVLSMFFRNKQVIAAALAVTLSFAASSAWAIGAIAVDDEEGTKASEVGYGVGYGSDKASAQREAVKQCKAA